MPNRRTNHYYIQMLFPPHLSLSFLRILAIEHYTVNSSRV